jgi:methionine-rich copper-binding protein CopC
MKQAVLLAALLCSFLITPQLFAHSKMAESSPAAGETVKTGLSEIKLNFERAVHVTLVKIIREGNEEQVEPTSEFPKSFADKIKLTVPPLDPSAYKVEWTAVAEDGHVMQGEVPFTVAD